MRRFAMVTALLFVVLGMLTPAIAVAGDAKAMLHRGFTTVRDVGGPSQGIKRAIVDVAKTWNTYVAIHANTDAAIREAVNAGVMSVEHGFFIEEETAKLMAEKGAWWSMEPLMNDEDAFKFESPISTVKYEQCVAGLDKLVALAKKYKVKTAFGTDKLFDPKTTAKQGKLIAPQRLSLTELFSFSRYP